MKYLYTISLFFFVASFAVGANKESEPRKYYALCREINAAYKRDLASSLTQIKEKKDYAEVQYFQCELDFLKQQLEQKRECVLLQFKNYYAISDSNWNEIRSKMASMHGVSKKSRLAGVYTDENFPEDAQLLIKGELEKRIIRVKCIDLLSTTDDSFVCGIEVGRKKRTVSLNLNYWGGASLCFQQFISARIAEELAEELSLLPFLLKSYWGKVVELNKQEDFVGFSTLRDMTKIISMLSLCFKNEKNAGLVKKYANCLVNSSFTSDDYAFISKIKRCWNALNVARQYCTAPLSLTKSVIGLSLSFSSSDEVEDSIISKKVKSASQKKLKRRSKMAKEVNEDEGYDDSIN